MITLCLPRDVLILARANINTSLAYHTKPRHTGLVSGVHWSKSKHKLIFIHSSYSHKSIPGNLNTTSSLIHIHLLQVNVLTDVAQTDKFSRLFHVQFITARLYGSAVYAMTLRVCLSSCVCLCLSQVGVLLKRLNAGSHKENHTIAHGL